MRPCVNQHLLMIIPNLRQAMTKNLGNTRYMPPKDAKTSMFSKAAPALFPLVAAVLGYMIGKQFFGI